MALRAAFLEGLETRHLSALPEAMALARRRMGGELLACASPANPTLLLGYQQSVDDFDPRACSAAGVEMGRRFCAGDAFLVGERDLLFALSTTRGAGWSFRLAVDAALGAVADAVRESGANPRHKLSAVLVGERRVAAATATRKWGGHLMCGYILLGGPLGPFAGPLMLSLKELAANYTTVGAGMGRELPVDAFIQAFTSAWCERVGETSTERSGREELKELDGLAAGKYSQERWLGVR